MWSKHVHVLHINVDKRKSKISRGVGQTNEDAIGVATCYNTDSLTKRWRRDGT